MAQLTDQQKALLAAANMPVQDDDDAGAVEDAAEAVGDAAEAVETVAEAVADDEPPVTIVEAPDIPAPPDPMEAAEAQAVVIAAEADAAEQVIEAQAEAAETVAEASAEAETEVIDALPDEAFEPDPDPRSGHRWFRSLRG